MHSMGGGCGQSECIPRMIAFVKFGFEMRRELMVTTEILLPLRVLSSSIGSPFPA
jgi:hypothetical protein